MKIISIVFISILIFNSISKAEIKDCSKLNKLSKEYLKCTKDNLKQKSDEKGLTTKFENFKSSKTLTEFFKKNRNENEH